MPVRITKAGGYRYGSSGKTYHGTGAKAKAVRQSPAREWRRRRRPGFR